MAVIIPKAGQCDATATTSALEDYVFGVIEPLDLPTVRARTAGTCRAAINAGAKLLIRIGIPLGGDSDRWLPRFGRRRCTVRPTLTYGDGTIRAAMSGRTKNARVPGSATKLDMVPDSIRNGSKPDRSASCGAASANSGNGRSRREWRGSRCRSCGACSSCRNLTPTSGSLCWWRIGPEGQRFLLPENVNDGTPIVGTRSVPLFDLRPVAVRDDQLASVTVVPPTTLFRVVPSLNMVWLPLSLSLSMAPILPAARVAG